MALSLHFLNLMKSVLLIVFLISSLATAGTRDCIVFVQSSAKSGSGISLTADDAFSGLVAQYRAGRNLLVSSAATYRLNKSGGPCAPACAVNITQGLRVMAGQPPLSDPIQTMRDLYAALPFVKRGDIANDGIVDILNHLFEQYLPGQKFNLRIRQLNINDTFSGRNVELTNELRMDDLLPKKGEMKLISVLIFEPSGKHLGGHYFVMQRLESNILKVIDPNFPEHDAIFDIQTISVSGRNNPNMKTYKLIPRGKTEVFNSLSREGKPLIFIDSVLSVVPQ